MEKDSASGHLGLLRAGKWITVVLLFGFMAMVYLEMGVRNEPFEKVSAKLKACIDENEMTDVSTRGLQRYYGLNSADYEGTIMYISSNGMSAEEMLLIKVKSEDQLGEVEEVIRKRLGSRYQDFENYAPQQAELLKRAQLIVRGNYIFLSVSEKALELAKVFKENT